MEEERRKKKLINHSLPILYLNKNSYGLKEGNLWKCISIKRWDKKRRRRY